MRLALKQYQREAIDVLGSYCDEVRTAVHRGIPKAERAAYDAVKEPPYNQYYEPPGFADVPCVCLRIATGGGKTLMAAHAVGTTADKLLGTDCAVCLWITPSTVIRDQTLRGLKTYIHPLRMALQDALSADIEVLTLEEAMNRSQPLRPTSAAAVVIVATIQSYRLQDGTCVTRKIYEDNGYMRVAFENLPQSLKSSIAYDAPIEFERPHAPNDS